MPEKTKIHLKSGSNNRNGGGSSLAPLKPVRETKSSAARKAAIAAKSQKQNQNGNSESTHFNPLAAEVTKAGQYKRSKSVGPVIEAAQRELLASAASIGKLAPLGSVLRRGCVIFRILQSVGNHAPELITKTRWKNPVAGGAGRGTAGQGPR